MPKLKTHSGTKDRIRVTRNGKVMRRHSSRNHFLQKKSSASKRRLSILKPVKARIAKNIKLNLGE